MSTAIASAPTSPGRSSADCSSPSSIGAAPSLGGVSSKIAVALTALSGLAPAAAGDDVPSRNGLVAIHLLAATIITPVLARQTTR